MSIDADEDEHSIEMQLPYIAKVVLTCPHTSQPSVCAGHATSERELHHSPRHGGLSFSQLWG